jgi:hypothetical protein
MPTKTLDTPTTEVPYETESFGHPEYGGAACIRMTLMSKKVGQTGVPDQAALYAQAHGLNDPSESGANWDIDPQGYVQTMDTRDTGPRSYVIYTFLDQAEANAKIAFTIDHYEVAPGVLIGGGTQWVLATGYETESGTLQWLKVHDPSFNGSGTPFTMIPALDWNTTWFKTVSRGTKWLGKYTTVCDPEPKGDPLPPADRPHPMPGDRLIEPGEAIELAIRGIQDYRLDRFDEFKVALKEGQAVRPFLVRDIDQEDRQYYLVPFDRRDDKRGTSVAVATIDARFGDLLATSADPRGIQVATVGPREIPRLLDGFRIPRYEPIEEIRSRISAELFSLLDIGRTGDPEPARFARIQAALTQELLAARHPLRDHIVEAREVEISRTLVWRPTPYSATPLAPFWQVYVGSLTLYVRLWDGLIVTDLLYPWLWRLGG